MADKEIPSLTSGGAAASGDVVHAYRNPNSRKVTLGGAAGLNVGTTAGTVAAGDSTVNLTGTQTVAGVKTFSSTPVVPDASFGPAKLDNGASLSLLGRSANSSGVRADIVAASDYQVMRRSGTAIAFGAVDLAQSAAVTGVLPAANHPDASTSGKGISELATDAEAIARSDTSRVLTPSNLAALQSGRTLAIFYPFDNEPPSSNYAELTFRNLHPVLAFDTTTQEAAIFSGLLPKDYGGHGITVLVSWAAASATSGTGGWDVSIERIDVSSLDIDADSFATAQTITATTVPGTTGQVLTTSVAISSGANMDSLAAGENYRIRVRRDVSNDTAAGDLQLVSVEIRET